jgi:tRNA(fMet)-specific endonuclease VapC
MGMILDSSVLIQGERRGHATREILASLKSQYGEVQAGISAVSVVELTHGIYRAQNTAVQQRRKAFVEEVVRALLFYPVTLRIAQLAGRIEGEQAAKGITIPFEDLLIGCTALHFGFSVVTANVGHFQKIPGLTVNPF